MKQPNLFFTPIVIFVFLVTSFLPGGAVQARTSQGLSANTIILNESFESNSLPRNWQVFQYNENPGWTFDNPQKRNNQTGGTGNFAIVDSDHIGELDVLSGLVTPQLDLSGATNVALSFKTYFMAYDESYAAVYVRHGTNNWSLIWSKKGADFRGSVRLDVSNIVGGKAQVEFMFLYGDANYDWYWQIDDVVVEGATPVSAPTGLSATVEGYNVNLSWSDNSPNETGFIIERSTNAGAFTQIARVTADTTHYSDNNLNCDLDVSYRVHAVQRDSSSENSNTVSVKTAACPALADVDENFNTGLPGSWSTVINKGQGWIYDSNAGNNNTGGEGGFMIANSDAAGQIDMDAELRTPVLNLAGKPGVRLSFKSYFEPYDDSTADVDVSTDGGKTWVNIWRRSGSQFRGPVEIDISGIAGNQSNVIVRFHYYKANWDYYWEVDDVKIDVLGAPSAPTNLSATITPTNAVNLSWKGSPGANYKVERAVSGQSFATIANLSNGANTYVDDSVASNTTYEYRVVAYNAAGTSPASTAVSVITGDQSVRYIDITVSLYRNSLTQDVRSKYEKIFKYFADGIYEASNGVHKLRQVKFFLGGRNSNSAQIIWIQNCHPNAHIGGYFTTGLRIEMCDQFSSIDFLGDAESDQEAAGYTLAHEMGHFFYSLYDEYKGSSNNSNIDSPQASDIPVENSMMNSMWNAVSYPNRPGDYRWLNFSTAVNNNQPTNAQFRSYGASAWETLVRPASQDPRPGYLAYTPERVVFPELQTVAPAANQLPSVQMPAGRTAAHSSLQFVWLDTPAQVQAMATQGLRSTQSVLAANGVMRQIVIDVSQPMQANGGLEAARDAVSQLIGQLPDGDTIGIITYDGTVQTLQPPVDLNAGNRSALQALVAALTAGNAESAPGAALSAALAGLTSPSVPREPDRAVYWITSGAHSTGPYPLDIAPDYSNEFTSLYVFAYDSDELILPMLNAVTNQTGGDTFMVGSADDLLDALKDANRSTSIDPMVGVHTGWGEATSDSSYSETFAVDSTLGELSLEMVLFGDSQDVVLSLVDPDGYTYDIDQSIYCENWDDATERDNILVCGLGIEDPLSGLWALDIQTGANPVDFLYWVDGIARAETLTFTPTVNVVGSSRSVSYPEPIVVGASVGEEFLITGLTVTGIIEDSEGNYLDFELRDDGIAPDAIEGDGIYSAVLDYWQDGEYNITVLFDNKDLAGRYTDVGTHVAGDLNLPQLNTAFQRYAESEVTVTGWQEDDHTDWPDDPDWQPTELTVDNTAVSGRIDFADDADVFKISIPADYEGDLGLRIDRLGLDMDPYLYLYAEDYSWEFDAYLEYTPEGGDSLFVPLDAMPGTTFYVEVWHYDETAETGVYNISAGPYLWSDPTAQSNEKPTSWLYLPFVTH